MCKANNFCPFKTQDNSISDALLLGTQVGMKELKNNKNK